MTKYQQVDNVQKQYRRGLLSRESAENAIREIMNGNIIKITQEYCDWLLDEYEYN